ncbi:hypothetical protein [Catellatospora sp. NPDC049609]|uniref:hypothetical protein n=1 Tax=Catellatospora sp. NPDC049609 TaxID=3155505 RepID=UPI003415D965
MAGLVVRGGVLAALVVAALAVGGALMPRMFPAVPAAVPSPSVSAAASSTSPSPGPAPSGGIRPADSFAGWARQVAPAVRVPVGALQAYAYAEWVTSQTRPTCRLSWTTLAALGKLATDHGTATGATLDPASSVTPPIVGPPLDGRKGRIRVADTDAGFYDGDVTWDHAVGPMQLLPATWAVYGVDADGDQLADPHDLDDAALSTAYRLCAPGKDLTVADNWKTVIAAHDGVGANLQKVYDTAQAYGRQSTPRPSTPTGSRPSSTS